MIRLGFHLKKDSWWIAGHTYLASLLSALREGRTDSLALYLLRAGPDQRVPDGLEKMVDEILAVPSFTRWTALWAIDRGSKWLLRYDFMGDLFLTRHDLDAVVFGEALWRSQKPVLSWIPDFQHLRLPEMFSVGERVSRNRAFRRIARRATRVLVLSESVKRDYEAFAPKFASKVRVLRPVSPIHPSVYTENAHSVATLYHLPQKFMYVPNQFWKHKNHGLVFRAVQILKERGVEIFLVCSGHPGDYRHPTYFADLLVQVARLGIRDHVAFLGVLPRSHVLALIRQSVGVLNPSLFEGYGMTVDEARSIGKQVILSDIPAHREQSPPQALFFDPNDSEDLAAKLAQAWKAKSPGPDLQLEAEARESLPGRRAEYARSFLSIVEEVVAPRGKGGE
jgi:glycosyltransferase involved in cell wall biosynthesis